MRIRAKTLSQILDGTFIKGNPDSSVGSFSIDTRSIQPGQWFLVFKGKTVDGHDFIPDAVKKGASGLIVSDPTLVPNDINDIPVISVENPLIALKNFASYIRLSTALFPWYAITGSVGKTTTKGILAQILKCEGSTPLVTPGNYNTDIGVPLTISRFFDNDYDSFVLEFAMRAKGDIEYLAEMTKPHVGIITNVNPCHLETLGSLEEIAEAKAELLKHIDERGTAVLNLDDHFYDFFRSKFKRHAVTFSINGNRADVTASDWEWDDEKNIKFNLAIQGSKPEKIKLNTPSMGIAQSAIAAAAAAVAGKISDDHILEGITSYSGEELRMSIFTKESGVRVILDCYNANPKSMVDSLKVLSLYKKEGRTIAVLGGMLELGEDCVKYHQQVADTAAFLDIDIIISVGAEGNFYYEQLKKENRKNIHHFNTNDDVNGWLGENAKHGDTVLIKGSRGFKLEQVGEGDW
ncbi:MAG: UDP-N-acetylmuramoyl-tripeptide--D-alanyl-D-alanine ligase [bacterium]